VAFETNMAAERQTRNILPIWLVCVVGWAQSDRGEAAKIPLYRERAGRRDRVAGPWGSDVCALVVSMVECGSGVVRGWAESVGVCLGKTDWSY
jgi:hypothetical protein